MISQPQQVLMTSSGQIIVMSAQPNKNSGQVVVTNNATSSTGASSNLIHPQQSVVGGNGTQYMNIAGPGGTVTTIATNNNGIIQNISQQQQQHQQNIIHAGQQSNVNSNFLINSPNNMQSTVILNNGQQILSASNNPQVIHSGNVLATAAAKVIGNAGAGGMISNQLINTNNPTPNIPTNNSGVISQQSGTTMVMNSLPPNSIVIQPNYSSVSDGAQIVNQVINQDGTTTSFVQHQNQQRQILISPDSKRKAKKRKSNGSVPMAVTGSSPQQPQHTMQLTATHSPQQQPTAVQQQTIQSVNQGTMLQLAPQYSTQSFQLSPGLSGLTIVPNQKPQQHHQQQQILLQNGQIITQPYNIISQQVLLPAGLVMAPDATTLVQIQNVATPCGSIITTPQGMVIRAQSPHQQKSFISPNTGQQFILNNNGQVSPMGAQIYGGPVNIVVPQQQAGPAASSFVSQNATILQQQPTAIVHQQQPIQVQSAANLNTSTDSSNTASESPSLPTTPQPPPVVMHHQPQKSHSSYLSGAASPPDTTTHSPNSPDCASSEKSAGSADSTNMVSRLTCGNFKLGHPCKRMVSVGGVNEKMKGKLSSASLAHLII